MTDTDKMILTIEFDGKRITIPDGSKAYRKFWGFIRSMEHWTSQDRIGEINHLDSEISHRSDLRNNYYQQSAPYCSPYPPETDNVAELQQWINNRNQRRNIENDITRLNDEIALLKQKKYRLMTNRLPIKVI